jgi:23S rRNA (cytidine1920-2'-O)/16S rRNA (cytidine1409-2'-O)-methyltransferase
LKDRADKVLTELGLVPTRSQAKSLIEGGHVTYNGKIIKRPGEIIDSEAKIEVTAPLFVGRGAFKLEEALKAFNVDVKNLVMMDVGASTGGFTEVLLNHGATKVYAIDVGHDQLAIKLREDSRVINMEGINMRALENLPETCDGAVMDVSFISITKVLANIKKLLKPQGFLIALIKPQFEAGIDRLPKDGIIKSDRVRAEILAEVNLFATQNGWSHLQTIPSPIEGKNGNIEFLSYFKIKD